MTATPSPRQFAAYAKPRPGDPEGHAVLLVETCGRRERKVEFSRAEAEQVHAELGAALRAFFVGESVTGAQALVEMVADAFKLHPTELTGGARTRRVVRARWAAFWLLRERLNLPLREIAAMLERNDHSTVRHALTMVDDLRRRDPEYRALTDELLRAATPATAPMERAA